MTKPKKQNDTILIYNPHAGQKRNLVKMSPGVTLEDVKNLLIQYQIPVDYSPTKRPKHAIELARQAIKQGYTTVLVAGGDGTITEVANGLVNSKVKLGIIPMGTFMNIARMLSIPNDLEKAVQLLKIGRTRKIDVGCVIKLDGEKVSEPYCFLEMAGVGLDAEFHRRFKKIENGKFWEIIPLIKILMRFYKTEVTVKTDDKEILTRASQISISNAPYSGPIEFSPDAKLNDHRLTVTIYRMGKRQLARYFFGAKNKTHSRLVSSYKTTRVLVTSSDDLQIHADASLFGTTPAEFKVVPEALEVICGFPPSKDQAYLVSRTALDP